MITFFDKAFYFLHFISPFRISVQLSWRATARTLLSRVLNVPGNKAADEKFMINPRKASSVRSGFNAFRVHLMAAHSSDAEECLRDIPYPDELLCNKAFHENFICARQFSEFVMQNTRLDSQCFPADTHRPGKHFPFTQHFSRSSSSPLSCLHECLPELFFHVTVARFINSLPLPRCRWIISPKNTL